jgi:hypothetical protein
MRFYIISSRRLLLSSGALSLAAREERVDDEVEVLERRQA